MIDASRATTSSASAPGALRVHHRATAAPRSPPATPQGSCRASGSTVRPHSPTNASRLSQRRERRCNHVEDILPVNAARAARSFRQMICQSVISSEILERLGSPTLVMTNGGCSLARITRQVEQGPRARGGGRGVEDEGLEEVRGKRELVYRAKEDAEEISLSLSLSLSLARELTDILTNRHGDPSRWEVPPPARRSRVSMSRTPVAQRRSRRSTRSHERAAFSRSRLSGVGAAGDAGDPTEKKKEIAKERAPM